MKFLLINPPNPELNNPDMQISYPLGLLYLASVLEKNNIKVSVCDLVDSVDWEGIFRRIKNEKPDVIGIRSLSTNRYGTFRLVRLINKELPETRIVLGGQHASFLYMSILERYDIDGIFIGEPEESIIKYVDSIGKPELYSDIPGFAYKYNGKIIKNPIYENTNIDIDKIPIPAYHLVDFKKYGKNKDQGYDFHIVTSRGCPYRCNFCAVPLLNNKYRKHSVKRVISEIVELNNYNRKKILKLYIHDDLFPLSGKWTEDFCQELLRLDFKVSWTVRGRIDNVSEKTLSLMKKSGCELISSGLESGSKKMLKLMNKETDISNINDTFMKIHKAGIKTGAYIILGYPGETLKTMIETLKVMISIRPTQFSISYPRLFPGTPIYEQAKKLGKINDDYWFKSKKRKLKNNLPLFSDMNQYVLIFYSYLFSLVLKFRKLIKLF